MTQARLSIDPFFDEIFRSSGGTIDSIALGDEMDTEHAVVVDVQEGSYD